MIPLYFLMVWEMTESFSLLGDDPFVCFVESYIPACVVI